MLPDSVIEIINKYNYNYNTFGELSMLYYCADESSAVLFENLQQLGFDLSILKEVV